MVVVGKGGWDGKSVSAAVGVEDVTVEKGPLKAGDGSVVWCCCRAWGGGGYGGCAGDVAQI